MGASVELDEKKGKGLGKTKDKRKIVSVGNGLGKSSTVIIVRMIAFGLL